MLDMDIALIKGLVDLTKFDLQKFSTKTICETAERIQGDGKETLTIEVGLFCSILAKHL